MYIVFSDEILKKLCYLEALLEHEFKRLHVRLDQIEGNPTSRRGAILHPLRIATLDAYEDVRGKLHDGDYRELLVSFLQMFFLSPLCLVTEVSL